MRGKGISWYFSLCVDMLMDHSIIRHKDSMKINIVLDQERKRA